MSFVILDDKSNDDPYLINYAWYVKHGPMTLKIGSRPESSMKIKKIKVPDTVRQGIKGLMVVHFVGSLWANTHFLSHQSQSCTNHTGGEIKS